MEYVSQAQTFKFANRDHSIYYELSNLDEGEIIIIKRKAGVEDVYMIVGNPYRGRLTQYVAKQLLEFHLRKRTKWERNQTIKT